MGDLDAGQDSMAGIREMLSRLRDGPRLLKDLRTDRPTGFALIARDLPTVVRAKKWAKGLAEAAAAFDIAEPTLPC